MEGGRIITQRFLDFWCFLTFSIRIWPRFWGADLYTAFRREFVVIFCHLGFLDILGCPESRDFNWPRAPKSENFEHSGVSQIEDSTSAGRPAGGFKK